MGRKLAGFGIGATLIYLALWCFIVWGKWDDFKALALNSQGDFLAGVFGPLTLLWLVLGYFQQGIELRQNSRALHLQAKELAIQA